MLVLVQGPRMQAQASPTFLEMETNMRMITLTSFLEAGLGAEWLILLVEGSLLLLVLVLVLVLVQGLALALALVLALVLVSRLARVVLLGLGLGLGACLARAQGDAIEQLL